MKKNVLILCIMAVIGCTQKKDITKNETCAKSTTLKGSGFKMYEMSEMSLLMERMYADNKRLRQQIIDGDTIGRFPNYFLKIHQATMTDESENDVFFKTQAAVFIRAQKRIYADQRNAEEHFNAAVKVCVQCHQRQCSSPLVRIKKLYIE
ncbi:MAG: hypothetical protein H7199_05270 [Burkholderiales bacterium]|nr:hypothetical protein [Flavobacterium sp.]